MIATMIAVSTASTPSPLQQYRAQLEQRFVVTPPQQPVQGFHPPTPAYSRGEITIIDEPTLRIVAELGPILINHVYRGPAPDHLVSVWA
jgi:hypothetical protein